MVGKQKNVKYDHNIVYDHNPPETMEQLYYRTIFENFYKDQAHLIPYFWMPKYIDATDSSARTLEIYNTELYTLTENSDENEEFSDSSNSPTK